MEISDPCSYPPHTKGPPRVSTRPFMYYTFNRLLFHRLNSEVLTGVTYSIISSIKVRFNAPQGDIPSGWRQPDLFTGGGGNFLPG